MLTRTTTPRDGDAIVTLKSQHTPLDERVHLLGYAFAKVVQGAELRRVVAWDVKGGCVIFIVGGGAANPGPRGSVELEVQDWTCEAERSL